jgi:nucleoside-diphosphate-sugar epimerase
MMPLETDTIIHLAAINQNTQDSAFDEEYFRVNTELTAKLFRYFMSSKAKTFIFISTTALADKQLTHITESSVVQPTDPFLKSKYEAEQFIQKQELPAGKRAIILRVAPLYGRETKSILHNTFIHCKIFPWFYGALDAKHSFCHIDNLTEIIYRITENPEFASGIYNVADEEPIDSIQFVNWMAEVLEKKISIYKVPKGLLNFVAKMGNVFQWNFNTQKLFEKSQTRIVNCNKIKDALQLEKMPVNTQAAVLKTIEYYNSIKI